MFVIIFLMILITCVCFECVNVNVNECCPNDVITTFNNPRCKNNQSINLFCPNGTLQVHYEEITKYNYINHCFKNQKWICTANITDVVKGNVEKGLVICKEEIEYCELVEKFDNEWLDFAILVLYIFLNLLSALLLFATSISYFVIDVMNDTQGICVRHYALSLGFAHAITSMNVFNISTLANHICIVYVYLSLYFGLTSFVWMNILAYGIWKSARGHSSGCDKRRYVWYCAIGYGFPLVDLTIAFSKALIKKNWRTDKLKNCYFIESNVFEEFVLIPLVLIVLMNLFYFVDSLRRLLNTVTSTNHAENTRTSTTLQVVKFRTCLYFKLFVVTGTIWTIVGILLAVEFFKSQFWIFTIFVLLASGEGIFIFMILVATRKKVLQGLARRTYFGKNIFPKRWRNFQVSEANETVFNVHFSNNSNIAEE